VTAVAVDLDRKHGSRGTHAGTSGGDLSLGAKLLAVGDVMGTSRPAGDILRFWSWRAWF